MYSLKDIQTFQLPDKTLCLTFDDGPGQYSLEIAEFLKLNNIRACFFVVGKFAENNQDTLKKMSELGHIIGNHTYEHPDMPYYVSVNGDIVDQIVRTNALISPFQTDDITYFRAPYGKWSPEVAKALNIDLRSSFNHVGPIHWDIPGIDCYYWKIGKSIDETVEAYLNEIETKGSGVVVMHDEIADMDVVKNVNKTHLLIKKLIPILLEKGYQFIGIDEIESEAMTHAKQDKIFIKNSDGAYLNMQQKADSNLKWNHSLSNSEMAQFNIEFNHSGKVQIKTMDNQYLMVDPDKNENVSIHSHSNEMTQFDFIPIRNNQFMLRSFNGNYFCTPSDKKCLCAAAPFMRQAEVFSFEHTRSPFKLKLSMNQKMDLLKKRWLFIKSKLMQS